MARLDGFHLSLLSMRMSRMGIGSMGMTGMRACVRQLSAASSREVGVSIVSGNWPASLAAYHPGLVSTSFARTERIAQFPIHAQIASGNCSKSGFAANWTAGRLIISIESCPVGKFSVARTLVVVKWHGHLSRETGLTFKRSIPYWRLN